MAKVGVKFDSKEERDEETKKILEFDKSEDADNMLDRIRRPVRRGGIRYTKAPSNVFQRIENDLFLAGVGKVRYQKSFYGKRGIWLALDMVSHERANKLSKGLREAGYEALSTEEAKEEK